MKAAFTSPPGNLAPKSSFPRLMEMNIGAKNCDDPNYQQQLARLDVVILGFYKNWKLDGNGQRYPGLVSLVLIHEST